MIPTDTYNPYDTGYSQLITDFNPTPYKDWGVTGGYNRKLVLPDDVPPTQAHLMAKGATEQRALKVDEANNNALYVHDVGGSSGGGYSPTVYRVNQLSGSYLASGNATTLLTINSLSALYWIKLSFQPYAFHALAGAAPNAGVLLDQALAPGSAAQIICCPFWYDGTKFTGGGNDYLVFAPPLIPWVGVHYPIHLIATGSLVDYYVEGAIAYNP